MKKRVYIAWLHHHVIKEWYRYRECGMQLLSFDYHTDFRGAFCGKSGRAYPSEQTAFYMRKHIPCNDVGLAINDLENDEHIDFALRSKIIKRAFVFSHNPCLNRDWALSVPTVVPCPYSEVSPKMTGEALLQLKLLRARAPILVKDQSCRGVGAGSVEIRDKDLIVSYSEERHPLLTEKDGSQRAKLVTTDVVLDEVMGTFREYGFNQDNYILDFDCDFIRDPDAMTHGRLHTLKELIRGAKAITIAREPKDVIDCSEGKLYSEVIEAWFRGLIQGSIDDIEIIDEYETKIERSTVVDQTAIAEKLRECAKMQLEVANELQMTDGASTPITHEGGEGLMAESGQTDTSDYEKVIAIIRETRRAAVSHFQRKLGWGYDHAHEVMWLLEKDGLVGPDRGGGPREIFWDKFPRCL